MPETGDAGTNRFARRATATASRDGETKMRSPGSTGAAAGYFLFAGAFLAAEVVAVFLAVDVAVFFAGAFFAAVFAAAGFVAAVFFAGAFFAAVFVAAVFVAGDFRAAGFFAAGFFAAVATILLLSMESRESAHALL